MSDIHNPRGTPIPQEPQELRVWKASKDSSQGSTGRAAHRDAGYRSRRPGSRDSPVGGHGAGLQVFLGCHDSHEEKVPVARAAIRGRAVRPELRPARIAARPAGLGSRRRLPWPAALGAGAAPRAHSLQLRGAGQDEPRGQHEAQHEPEQHAEPGAPTARGHARAAPPAGPPPLPPPQAPRALSPPPPPAEASPS